MRKLLFRWIPVNKRNSSCWRLNLPETTKPFSCAQVSASSHTKLYILRRPSPAASLQRSFTCNTTTMTPLYSVLHSAILQLVIDGCSEPVVRYCVKGGTFHFGRTQSSFSGIAIRMVPPCDPVKGLHEFL